MNKLFVGVVFAGVMVGPVIYGMDFSQPRDKKSLEGAVVYGSSSSPEVRAPVDHDLSLSRVQGLLASGYDGEFWGQVKFDDFTFSLPSEELAALSRIYDIMMLRNRIFSQQDESRFFTSPVQQQDEGDEEFRLRLFAEIGNEHQRGIVPGMRFSDEECQLLEALTNKLLRFIFCFEEDLVDERYWLIQDLLDIFLTRKILQNYSYKNLSSVTRSSDRFTLPADRSRMLEIIRQLCILVQAELKDTCDLSAWSSLIKRFYENYEQWVDDVDSLDHQGPCNDDKNCGCQCSGEFWFAIQKGLAEDAESEMLATRLLGKDSRNGKRTRVFTAHHKDNSLAGRLAGLSVSRRK